MSKRTLSSNPESPCVGYCTTALGDDICKSCGRTFEEVNSWIVMSEEDKRLVWDRLSRIEAGRSSSRAQASQ